MAFSRVLHKIHVKNCSGTIVTIVKNWYMVQNCSYDFQVCLRYLCLCSSVPAKIFDYIWNFHNFERSCQVRLPYTTSLSLDGTPPTESDAQGIGIYKSMTEDESSQQPQEKHSLVVPRGLEDFCQQLPLWLWLCGNQPFKLASKVPVCDYCIMQRHVWGRFVLPQKEFVLARSLAISKSSSQTSLRQKTQPPKQCHSQNPLFAGHFWKTFEQRKTWPYFPWSTGCLMTGSFWWFVIISI